MTTELSRSVGRAQAPTKGDIMGQQPTESLVIYAEPVKRKRWTALEVAVFLLNAVMHLIPVIWFVGRTSASSGASRHATEAAMYGSLDSIMWFGYALAFAVVIINCMFFASLGPSPVPMQTTDGDTVMVLPQTKPRRGRRLAATLLFIVPSLIVLIGTYVLFESVTNGHY